MDSAHTDQATRLGAFNLIRKIAAGGMAEVWEARKEGLEGFSKRMAVKVILPHLTENTDFINMFLDEGRLAAQLEHPNICQIIDLGEEAGTYFMSMEYIDGVVLSAVMKEAARRGIFVPFEHCCQIAIGACAGLDYAHTAKDHDGNPFNLVHRDISPQNIMLTFDGNVKVVDFGIAKAATQIHHTQAGVLKGKYAYMSPEQATGEPLDHRSDVFAMGVVLWELTTGHRLFRAENEIATLHKIIGGDYESPSAYRDGYPPELELIVNKALAQDRNHRFQDCGEMQLALEDFLIRHSMAAGSKRLAYYVRWLLSDEEMPDLMSQSISSSVSQVFGDVSDPAIHTPSNASGVVHIPGAPAPRLSQAPTRQLPGFEHTGPILQGGSGLEMPTHEHSAHSPRKRKRRKRGVWVLLLLLLLGAGGGAGIFFYLQHPSEPKLKTWLIKSTPSGADVFVNGDKVGQTPTQPYVYIGRKYNISVSKKGFRTYRIAFEQISYERASKPLEVKLEKEATGSRYGFVTINVKPADATAILDKKELKGTPMAGLNTFQSKVLAGVKHVLVVRRKGYEEQTREITVKPGVQSVETVMLNKVQKKRRAQKKRRRVAVRRYVPPRAIIRRTVKRPKAARSVVVIQPGKLRVTSSPPGAIVRVNGRLVGSTPLRGFVELDAGKSHKLRVEKDGHKTYTTTLRLRSRQKRTIHAELRPSNRPMSHVFLSSNVRSIVYINNNRMGVTPFSKKLPVGRYSVEFRTAKYKVSYRKTLNFDKGIQRIFHRFKMGHLWVLSLTVARVFVGGDYLGKSRQPPYRVPAGHHKIRLVFPNGKSVRRSVYVRPGKKTRVAIRL